MSPPLPGGRRDADRGFRWRSREISRVEGFTDAVFAFAVTLLVVSLEVPRTFHELSESMAGFVAFAVGFALLFWIWYQQYIFFRRYGLEDGWTITLNGALLFVVLFFVYPLKFLFVNLVKMIAGRDTRVLMPDGILHPAIAATEGGALMVIYSTGYVAIFGLFFLLYRHAWRRRADLALTPTEEFLTRMSVREQLINVGVGGASVLMAVAGGDRWSGAAGWIYVLIGPLFAIHGKLSGRALAKLLKTPPPAP